MSHLESKSQCFNCFNLVIQTVQLVLLSMPTCHSLYHATCLPPLLLTMATRSHHLPRKMLSDVKAVAELCLRFSVYVFAWLLVLFQDVGAPSPFWPEGIWADWHLERLPNPGGVICGSGYKFLVSMAVGAAIISVEQHATMSLEIVQTFEFSVSTTLVDCLWTGPGLNTFLQYWSHTHVVFFIRPTRKRGAVSTVFFFGVIWK